MLQRFLSRQQLLSRLSASLSPDAEAEGASGSSASQMSLEVQPEQNPVDSSGRNPLRQESSSLNVFWLYSLRLLKFSFRALLLFVMRDSILQQFKM